MPPRRADGYGTRNCEHRALPKTPEQESASLGGPRGARRRRDRAGFNSHSAYYAWVAEQFAAEGLAVYALDLRGRRKSDGERCYVQKFADYVADVATFVALAKSAEPGVPAFLLGYSGGGVAAMVRAACSSMVGSTSKRDIVGD